MESSKIRFEEIPEGFSAVDPTNLSVGASAASSTLSSGAAATTTTTGHSNQQQSQSSAQDEQRRSILEQALTSEALARLGTIKVRTLFVGHSRCIVIFYFF
jgi:DNA-binding protein